MKLSIAMMIKNEEKHLENCLKSVLPILNNIESELIIIDTGSTDNSVNIASKFTKKIYHHKWDNNFSEMRNKTIEYSKGEWIFILDGDEVLENCDEIIKFLKGKKEKKNNSASIIGNNFVNSDDFTQYTVIRTTRLFKNDGTFKYEGTVHNQAIYKGPTISLDATLYHYGYIADDKELMDRKFKRTATILKKQLEIEPENLYYMFQLSVSYAMHGDNLEALKQIENTYNTMIRLDEKHKNIYHNYAGVLFNNKKDLNVEEIVKEGLKLEKIESNYSLDMYYYLAKSQQNLGKFDESIKNYEKYLMLMEKFNNKELVEDTSITNNSITLKENVILDKAIIMYNQKKYNKAIELIMEINDEKILLKSIDIFVESVVKGLYNNKLFDYYNLLSNNNKKVFKEILEKQIINNDEEKNIDIYNELAKINDLYGQLNKIRICQGQEKNEIIKNIELVEGDFYYGDILYIALVQGFDIIDIIKKLQYKSISQYLIYIFNKHKDFEILLIKYFKDNLEDNIEDFYRLRAVKYCLGYLLKSKKVDENDYKYIFKKFTHYGIMYIELIYNDFVLNNILELEINSNEDVFLMYILNANKYKMVDTRKYIDLLNKGLDYNKEMDKGIKILLNEHYTFLNEKREFFELKNNFISNIKSLISLGEYEKANNMIIEYENIIGTDAEITQMKKNTPII